MNHQEIAEMIAAMNDEEAEQFEIPESRLGFNATVRAVPRLEKDIAALIHLTNLSTPAEIPIRAQATVSVFYTAGDAAGRGFGGFAHVVKNQRPTKDLFRYGKWSMFIQESSSSNFRELCSLVDMLEEGLKNKDIKEGTELYIFTDNIVAKYGYYKGNASSKLLFDLVLRLRTAQMKLKLIIHVIHISGKHMIKLGVDALSRGVLTDEVMNGENLLQHIPMNKSVLEQSKCFRDWLLGWLPKGTQWTTPDDWFDASHLKLVSLWTPAPAA